MDHNGWPFDYDSALQVIKAQRKRIEELERHKESAAQTISSYRIKVEELQQYESIAIQLRVGFRALHHIFKSIEGS